jgi:hypothetical protein
MKIIKAPDSMLELIFDLPDDQLAEITMERPDVMKSICMGLTLELIEIEKIAKQKKKKKIPN